jgi:hypothetical protein
VQPRALQIVERRHHHLGALGAVDAHLGRAKDVLHRRLAARQQVARQALERVAALAEHARRVPQPRHVHRVAAKAAHIDAVVAERVPIEAVVVPHLPHRLVLKVGAKLLEHWRARAQRVDKQLRPRPKSTSSPQYTEKQITMPLPIGPSSFRSTSIASVSHACMRRRPSA